MRRCLMRGWNVDGGRQFCDQTMARHSAFWNVPPEEAARLARNAQWVIR